ncbi:MAG: phosphotransferase [Ancrocorticia sp.]|uniref:phosphotransferase n=2 Tax=Ancrocorticia sp. TaxID=2593684 RepID=UPI003F9080E7
MILPSAQDLVNAITAWVGPVRWHLGSETKLSARGYHIIREEEDSAALWLVLQDGHTDYNVPLVLSSDSATIEPVGTVSGLLIFDAAEHPFGQKAVFDLLTRRATGGADSPFTLRGMPLHRLDSPIVAAHKLTSEQSNTSVIYTFADDTKLILKIFRVLAAGHNPDVELQEALDGTGTVPGQYGSVNLTWNHAELQQGEDRGRGRADVVVVQEFLEGSTDAWQVMAEQLTQTNGTLGQTEESIRALGALTRRFHTELANSFPVAPATDAGRATIAASWRAREEAALDLVPELRVHQGAIEAAYANALAQPWPDLQRIHGDYHLGQVLEVPGSGWRALDFEGEPLRPLAERTRLDLALRDVAGMLRSFDYAAGSAELSGGDPQVLHAWAAAASDAFLAGYGDLDSAQDGLLHALMIDKALYEISYEAAERPSWLSVPVNGVERILRHVS